MRINPAALALLALCLAAPSSPALADGARATQEKKITPQLRLQLATLRSGMARYHRASHEGKITPQVRKQLAAVRAATAKYHDFDLATQPGRWDAPVPMPLECLDGPTGGMGYHFVNPNNVGVLDPARPQALIYEPERDGSMRLVAVEYIVFAPQSDPAPVLFDQPFHWNERFQIWALHAWVWRHNPDGVFANYNPIVSCRHEF